MKYHVYIVSCKDGSLYTGIALNISRRIDQHNSGNRGAKSLRGRIPVRLVYSEIHNTKGEALKREKEIQGWKRERKLSLVKNSLEFDEMRV